MDIKKINLWIVGSVLIFGCSLLEYLEYYRNNDWIIIPSDISILIGWLILFGKATKNTSGDSKDVLFEKNKSRWFKQRFIRIISGLTLLTILVCNGLLIIYLANNRQNDILQNQPTKTTIATISEIIERTTWGRYGDTRTNYYAIFEYTADNQQIEDRVDENDFDYIEGEKYKIKYSVEYPEMFLILEKEK